MVDEYKVTGVALHLRPVHQPIRLLDEALRPRALQEEQTARHNMARGTSFQTGFDVDEDGGPHLGIPPEMPTAEHCCVWGVLREACLPLVRKFVPRQTKCPFLNVELRDSRTSPGVEALLYTIELEARNEPWKFQDFRTTLCSNDKAK